MRRLDDARELDPELLQQVRVAVVHRDHAILLGVGQLRRRGSDRAQALRVGGGVRAEPVAPAGRARRALVAIA